MRLPKPIAFKQARITFTQTPSRRHNRHDVMRIHPDHLRQQLLARTRRRHVRGRDGPGRLRTTARIHSCLHQPGAAPHLALSRRFFKSHCLRRPCLCQQRQKNNDGAEKCHEFITTDASCDERLHFLFQLHRTFPALVGLCLPVTLDIQTSTAQALGRQVQC